MIISFEGIDGCGKSTQEQRLAEYLEEKGYAVQRVREPGGTRISEAIRDLLLDPSEEIDPVAEMLLFSAARAQLCRSVLQKWHTAGDIILCDRFFDSTIAYQGGGRGVAEQEWIRRLQEIATGGLIPNRTYYIRIDLETAEARRSIRANGNSDRMESEGDAFYQRVIAAYDTLAASEPERIRVIDGSKDVDTVFEMIREDMDAVLQQATS